MTKLHVQNGPLNSLHPCVVSDFDVPMSPVLGVIAQTANASGHVFVIRDDRPGLTKSAQVFARIKTEAADATDRPHVTLLVDRSVRLSGIFDQEEVISLGNLAQRLKVANLAVEMNGEDCPRLWRDGPLDLLRVEVIRHRVDVDKNRPRRRRS